MNSRMFLIKDAQLMLFISRDNHSFQMITPFYNLFIYKFYISKPLFALIYILPDFRGFVFSSTNCLYEMEKIRLSCLKFGHFFQTVPDIFHF